MYNYVKEVQNKFYKFNWIGMESQAKTKSFKCGCGWKQREDQNENNALITNIEI